MQRGIEFTAPTADSVPCLRTRQAQYTSRRLVPGEQPSGTMLAETHLQEQMLEEGRREMGDKWHQVVLSFRRDIERAVGIREATFETLQASYVEDMNAVEVAVINSSRRREPAKKTAATILSDELEIHPRLDDLGFRMCTITWGAPPTHAYYDTINQVLALCKIASSRLPGPPEDASEECDDAESADIPSQISSPEQKYSGERPQAKASSNTMTGEAYHNDRTLGLEQDAQDEVF